MNSIIEIGIIIGSVIIAVVGFTLIALVILNSVIAVKHIGLQCAYNLVTLGTMHSVSKYHANETSDFIAWSNKRRLYKRRFCLFAIMLALSVFFTWCSIGIGDLVIGLPDWLGVIWTAVFGTLSVLQLKQYYKLSARMLTGGP